MSEIHPTVVATAHVQYGRSEAGCGTCFLAMLYCELTPRLSRVAK
jgi:hypothetical protein